ncbi:MAG: cysteine desulfurase [SAR324 cluster bacterium]|nr:cysteine desulfurase [SAR324 cluster bacterium]
MWLEKLRSDFPILQRKINSGSLVYLDSAATTQKPRQVIEALSRFYEQNNANVHRGIYTLSEEASQLYEDAREKVSAFVHAPSPRTIVFTRGTTESINLVAHSWLKPRLRRGDEILVNALEHHSNLVPWQMAAKEKNAKLRYVPLTEEGILDLEALENSITDKTRILTVCSISNVLGTVTPLKKIIEIAHNQGVPVLVDAAQAVARHPINVETLECDFLAFSSHKMYGPTGIGVLFAKPEYLETMEPMMGGGGMIERVHPDTSTWAEYPAKFEAGTPAIAEAVGLSAAVDCLNQWGMDRIQQHEHDLMVYALSALNQTPDLTVFPPLDCHQKAGVLSFNMSDVHPHDVAQILDLDGIAVRAGHHCAQPLMKHLGVQATVRMSFGSYNSREDIDQLVFSLEKVRKIFSP